MIQHLHEADIGVTSQPKALLTVDQLDASPADSAPQELHFAASDSPYFRKGVRQIQRTGKKPAYPLSGFFIFGEEIRNSLRTKGLPARTAAITKLIKARWSKCTEKERYHRLSSLHYQDYRRLIKFWKLKTQTHQKLPVLESSIAPEAVCDQTKPEPEDKVGVKPKCQCAPDWHPDSSPAGRHLNKQGLEEFASAKECIWVSDGGIELVITACGSRNSTKLASPPSQHASAPPTLAGFSEAFGLAFRSPSARSPISICSNFISFRAKPSQRRWSFDEADDEKLLRDFLSLPWRQFSPTPTTAKPKKKDSALVPVLPHPFELIKAHPMVIQKPSAASGAVQQQTPVTASSGFEALIRRGGRPLVVLPAPANSASGV